MSQRAPIETGRERAVWAAGLVCAAALVWAAFTVYGDKRVAGEAAVTRLAGEVTDTVVAEWERMRRDSACPLDAALFAWDDGAAPLEPLTLRERYGESFELSVFDTLLEQAEQLEFVEGDLAAALANVLDALAREPGAAHRPEGILRALQLAARLGRADVLTEWSATARRELDERDGRRGIPYLLLCALAEGAAPLEDGTYDPTLFRRVLLDEDTLVPGDAQPFALAPRMGALCARLGVGVHELEGRRTAALARWNGALPVVREEGAWHVLELREQLVLARRDGPRTRACFARPGALAAALDARAALPTDFALDFTGDGDARGPVVRPRTSLAGARLEFVLRHADPDALARAEAGRVGTLRAALLALAVFCAAGGWFTARALARERRLAELKSSFVAGVSHDLRTPLASILLMAENLESGRVQAGGEQRYYGSIRREAERLRRLVDDVLDFSRIERGEGAQLALDDVDPASLLGELAQEARAHVARAGGALLVEAGPLPRKARLDPDALRRAIWNLVDNAVRHAGGDEVRLAWEVLDERTLRITVSDRGPGVPPASREAVFRPFERLNGVSHAGGTGLGLAIVREIARAHGGDARALDREEGRGATFELTLDLEEDSA